MNKNYFIVVGIGSILFLLGIGAYLFAVVLEKEQVAEAKSERIATLCKSENKDKIVAFDGYVRLPKDQLTCDDRCKLDFFERSNETEAAQKAFTSFKKGEGNNKINDLPTVFYTNYADFKLKDNNGSETGFGRKLKLTGKLTSAAESDCTIEVMKIESAPKPEAKVVTVSELCANTNDNEYLQVEGYVRADKNRPITWGGYVVELGSDDKFTNKASIIFNTRKDSPNNLVEYSSDSISKFKDINGNDVDINGNKFKLTGLKYTMEEEGEKTCRFEVEYIEKL